MLWHGCYLEEFALILSIGRIRAFPFRANGFSGRQAGVPTIFCCRGNLPTSWIGYEILIEISEKQGFDKGVWKNFDSMEEHPEYYIDHDVFLEQCRILVNKQILWIPSIYPISRDRHGSERPALDKKIIVAAFRDPNFWERLYFYPTFDVAAATKQYRIQIKNS